MTLYIQSLEKTYASPIYQTQINNLSMYKIEIKGTNDDLERISIFLENNHIKHNVEDDIHKTPVLEEMEEAIDWPL